MEAGGFAARVEFNDDFTDISAGTITESKGAMNASFLKLPNHSRNQRSKEKGALQKACTDACHACQAEKIDFKYRFGVGHRVRGSQRWQTQIVEIYVASRIQTS